VEKTIAWTRAWMAGEDLYDEMGREIQEYLKDKGENNV
jgi:hypothetical protein